MTTPRCSQTPFVDDSILRLRMLLAPLRPMTREVQGYWDGVVEKEGRGSAWRQGRSVGARARHGGRDRAWRQERKVVVGVRLGGRDGASG